MNLSGLVRLMDENGTHEDSQSGRLEVFYKGEWGTVCDDGDGKDGSSIIQGNHNMATVVCRMLNYLCGIVHNKAGKGQGTGRIWLDDVRCTGSELHLFDCPSAPKGSHSCHHGEDVGISCGNNCK